MVHRGLRASIGWAAALAGSLALSACEEEVPTSLDPNRFPEAPATAELLFSWEEFGSDFRTYGGYGSPAELPSAVLAHDYEGQLDSHTLVRFGAYPVAVSVRDTTGTTRPDSSLTYLGGRFVVFFDTIASRVDGPVDVELGATTVEWDGQTSNWWSSVDTAGNSQLWPEPGGGPIDLLGVERWDPEASDSVAFQIDSAQVAAWSDTSDASRGARVRLVTGGSRLDVAGTGLRLHTRPSVHPDSTFYLHVLQRDLTFVYDPYPTEPEEGGRIGGVPAWRTVFELTPPSTVNRPAALCEAVGCPATLEASEINYAAIVLTPRAVDAAFRPSDSVTVDARPVLSSDALPKSPLGPSLTGLLGEKVPPEVFEPGGGEGMSIEIPVTSFIRALVRGEDLRGDPVSHSLALLARAEPASLPFAAFYGPKGEHPPVLKMVVSMKRSGSAP